MMAIAAVAISDNEEAGRIGHNIASCMKQLRMTVGICASRLNISEDELRYYIDGNAIPDPPTLRKMSEVFRVPVSDICDKENIKPPCFGDELRKLRNDLGFTAKDLSEYTGISADTIYKIENNKCFPTKEIADKLTECFGESFSKIISLYNVRLGKSRKRTKNAAYRKELPMCTVDAKKDTSVSLPEFKPEWIRLIEAIDNDAEFRAVAMYLFNTMAGKREKVDFDGMPQASLVVKLLNLS